MPTSNGRRPRVNLGFDREMALIEMYASTDRPIKHIADHFGVRPTYPYRLLDKYAITWRRDSGTTFDFAEWKAAHFERVNARMDDVVRAQEARAQTARMAELRALATAEAAEDDALDLERLNADTGFATPGPLHQVPASRETWLVEITDRFEVQALRIEDAIQVAKELRPGARITSVRVKP